MLVYHSPMCGDVQSRLVSWLCELFSAFLHMTRSSSLALQLRATSGPMGGHRSVGYSEIAVSIHDRIEASRMSTPLRRLPSTRGRLLRSMPNCGVSPRDCPVNALGGCGIETTKTPDQRGCGYTEPRQLAQKPRPQHTSPILPEWLI